MDMIKSIQNESIYLCPGTKIKVKQGRSNSYQERLSILYGADTKTSLQQLWNIHCSFSPFVFVFVFVREDMCIFVYLLGKMNSNGKQSCFLYL